VKTWRKHGGGVLCVVQKRNFAVIRFDGQA